MISATSPLFAAVDLAIALIVSRSLVRLAGPPETQGRYVAIDGLRGYLAFFVFMHHSAIWYYFLHGEPWTVPPSRLYTNFGQASVSMFFMITGFLFYGKLLDGKRKKIDWTHLYVSRIFRLYPLYLFAIAILMTFVGIRSDWHIEGSATSLIKEIVKWFGFTVMGAPDVNNVHGTWIMVAGVTWTLVYEWAFYLSLPVLALITGITPPTYVLLTTLLCLIVQFHFWVPGFYWGNVHIWMSHYVFGVYFFVWMYFVSGVLAAILVRSKDFVAFARTRIASCLILISITSEFVVAHSSYDYKAFAALSVAFCLMAGGNGVFGLLTNSVSRQLGQVSYGIYLLQGLALYGYWKFVVGFRVARDTSVTGYWLIQSFLVPFFIILCFAAFRLIEWPAIKSVRSVTAITRGLSQRVT